MINKVLFCATVDYHFKAFHLPYLKWFKEQGWEVHVAASGTTDLPYVDKKFTIPIRRSPLDLKNVEAYNGLKAIMNENNYKIIHCHTPMGGVITRLAARNARKQGTKMIYTAHGFHFCKGAPLTNWLIYYPIEKILAHNTDCLITINQEDYQLASKRFKARTIELVNGVGVDTDVFKPLSDNRRVAIRKSFGYRPNDFLLFYAAEFNKNKNQQLLLHSLARIRDKVPQARLLLAGEGALLENCRELAVKLGISHMVDFLGFRKDIKELVSISDVAVGSSLREGLPVNVMEAMACGLPVVAIENRGHRELVHNNFNGWIIDKNDIDQFANKIEMLARMVDVKEQLGKNGRRVVLSTYSVNHILARNRQIYQTYMGEGEVKEWAVH
ncbi:glycosyltransferase family 4 protein [Halobacillus amylolyticus]|uniref:Glycosyltransferase family 4 protein n=1 Tax=Halobacillus amylolyticus TaxID=2932259 RepID=A0ABY4HGM2_9BACI|nr:glycosyltransferase family 4 protein [Halobacillus amylolyticus]UOR13802.1 glycosyltransferase family 4 protein [Halobacillus amylolyticus]